MVTIPTRLISLAHHLVGLVVRPAQAHCDTEGGPAVTDGRRALATGNVNHALKWVGPAAADEVRAAFGQASRVRTLGGEAADLADRYFLETLVRLHRAGEGAGFEGIKPAGTPLDPVVVAADRALAEGSLEPLRGLVAGPRWPRLEQLFGEALARRGADTDDLAAGRAWIAAYVDFVSFAEGESHDHGAAEDHGPAGHHGVEHAVAGR